MQVENKSLEQSPRSVAQLAETFPTWNPNVQGRVHKSLPLVIPSQVDASSEK
jgi:hypothetical protein